MSVDESCTCVDPPAIKQDGPQPLTNLRHAAALLNPKPQLSRKLPAAATHRNLGKLQHLRKTGRVRRSESLSRSPAASRRILHRDQVRVKSCRCRRARTAHVHSHGHHHQSGGNQWQEEQYGKPSFVKNEEQLVCKIMPRMTPRES